MAVKLVFVHSLELGPHQLVHVTCFVDSNRQRHIKAPTMKELLHVPPDTARDTLH
ncbi:hypothetical protein SESBI_26924 [Sesbania bispinosa]|nr:hypothetical protein SESBI_26924 [Sesbania bispinosa]